MEPESEKILSKILEAKDLEKIPGDVAIKVDEYFDKRFPEFLTTMASQSAAQRNIGKRDEYCLTDT